MLYNEGFKVMVFRIDFMTNEGLRKWKNVKKRIKKVYKPLLPVLFLTPDINTGPLLAEFIYNNFGASEEGTIYRVRYWQHKTKWSRRFKGLCTLELWDKKEGGFKFKILERGNLGRFGFWKG